MATPRPPPKYKGTVNCRPAYPKNPLKVYFRSYRPLKLKEQVIGSDHSSKKTPCIELFLEMMDCFKRTGFTDEPCKRHIEAYNKCNKEFKEDQQARQQQTAGDISFIKNTREMKRDQVNILLRNFHQKS